MTIIKICGITRAEDAIEAASLGADMIGLVFAESSRRIRPEATRAIVAALAGLAARPAAVGIFVNEDPQTVNRIAATCGLDAVQLSGSESWEYCRRIKLPAIKAVHVGPAEPAAAVQDEIARGLMQAGRRLVCLLDSKDDRRYGGTGRSFDWKVAAKIGETCPVMVAGGLSPANVAELVRRARPLGVDVSSGVETAGRKDPAKIRAFIEIVRSFEPGAAEDGIFMRKFLSKGERHVAR